MTKQESDKLKEEIIKTHIESLNGIQGLSVKYFADTGIVSGSLFTALKTALDEYAKEYLTKRVEAITDEIIKQQFPNTFVTEAQISLDDIYAPYRKEGANWLKQTLLNND